MAEKSNFDKYLAGEPLNEQLAAIRAGKADDQLPLAEILQGWAARETRPIEDQDRPLNKAERLTLREAQQAGAVTTLIRLLTRNLRVKIRNATLDSENDPLGRQAEIAQSWAYVMAFRRASMEIEALILAEIAEQEKEEAGTTQ